MATRRSGRSGTQHCDEMNGRVIMGSASGGGPMPWQRVLMDESTSAGGAGGCGVPTDPINDFFKRSMSGLDMGLTYPGAAGVQSQHLGFKAGPGPPSGLPVQQTQAQVPSVKMQQQQQQPQVQQQSNAAPSTTSGTSSFQPQLQQDDALMQSWAEAGGCEGRSRGKGRQAAVTVSDTERKLREAAAAEVAQKRTKTTGGAGGAGATRVKVESSCGAPSVTDPLPSPSGSAVGQGTKRKAAMTAEEKAAHSRYRNREHARNTRLRKKAYMKKLKELVEDLEKQRKEASRTTEAASSQVAEQQTLRRQTALTFLHLRATNERDRAQWERVLDESFTLSLPITPYRYFSRHEVAQSTRLVRGVDAAMADAASLKVMVEGLRRTAPPADGSSAPSPKLRFVVQSADIVVAKDTLMCRWVAQTEDCMSCGAMAELSLEGMMYCKSTPEGKLLSVEMVFDVMSVMQQLQRASGVSSDALIVPNCLEATCQRSSCARIIVKSEPPFMVLHVNEQWTALTGYTQTALEGRPLDLLQGGVMGPEQMVLLHDVSRGRPSSCVTLAFRSTGQGFMAHFQLYPLGAGSGGGLGPSAPTHLMGTLRELSPSWTAPPMVGGQPNMYHAAPGMQSRGMGETRTGNGSTEVYGLPG